MLSKIINVKEFAHFLRINRNNIIEHWLDDSRVKNILHKHSFIIEDTSKRILYEFCDCFISIVEWDLTIADCQAKISFLRLLNKHNISVPELFTLIMKLKSSIEHIIYKNGYLAKNVEDELEELSLNIANLLTENYMELKDDQSKPKNEHTNLLNEYKKAVDLSNIVSKTNPKGIITYVNDEFCDISGYEEHELIGKPHNIIRHPSMDPRAFKDLWDTIKSKRPWHGIVTNMKKDGRKYIVATTVVPILDVDGDIIEYIAIRHDITELEDAKEQLKNINDAMKHKVDELYSMTSVLEKQATYDSLTNIYNRMKFEELFSIEIRSALNEEKSLSMIIFDIDHFKVINDTYGHQIGDEILVDIASLISKNIKLQDIFARWGGEEFIILLPGTDLDSAMLFAEKLRKLIEKFPFKDVGKLTASFGAGELEKDESKTTFFEKVDKALYLAKENGRNRVEKSI